MSKFKVTISNDTSDYVLVFDLLDTDIALKWANEINQQHPFFENWRFTGWPGSVWTPEKYIDEINNCINIVNDYHPGIIKATASIGMSQEDTNYLHKFFETLRGGVLSPTEWYLSAPNNVKEAISNFNVFIHNYEKVIAPSKLSSTITCTFTGPRKELTSNDCKHFTYDWKFGTVYINYCEVGKHLLEVFVDNDNIVGDHNIRPLKYYSADFKIKFCTDVDRTLFEDFSNKLQQWVSNNKEKFTALGITEYNIGFIPVAVLNYNDSGFNGLSQSDIIYKLSIFNKVTAVKIEE